MTVERVAHSIVALWPEQRLPISTSQKAEWLIEWGSGRGSMPQPMAALALILRNAGAKERCHAARDNVYRPCGPCGFTGACQFWICTARYNFQDLTANNNGDFVHFRAISAGPR
jgi:hypothetical protein